MNALHQQGVQQLFVYLPDESVYCSEKDGEQFLLTAPAHTTVDSFGADDGFMAGLVYSFLKDTVSGQRPFCGSLRGNFARQRQLKQPYPVCR